MQHVVTDGVAPTHVPPLGALRIVLVEEVVFALVVDEAVGIVHKILGGREVKLRAPRLIVDTLSISKENPGK